MQDYFLFMLHYKKFPAAKGWGKRSTGKCHSGGKQLFVYPFTFYHFSQHFIYPFVKFGNIGKATKDLTLVAIIFCIKELPEYLYQ